MRFDTKQERILSTENANNRLNSEHSNSADFRSVVEHLLSDAREGVRVSKRQMPIRCDEFIEQFHANQHIDPSFTNHTLVRALVDAYNGDKDKQLVTVGRGQGTTTVCYHFLEYVSGSGIVITPQFRFWQDKGFLAVPTKYALQVDRLDSRLRFCMVDYVCPRDLQNPIVTQGLKCFFENTDLPFVFLPLKASTRKLQEVIEVIK